MESLPSNPTISKEEKVILKKDRKKKKKQESSEEFPEDEEEEEGLIKLPLDVVRVVPELVPDEIY